MHISPAAPTRVHATSDALVVRSPDELPASFRADSPESRVMSTYIDDLFSMVGVQSIGYNRVTNPGELRVSLESYDIAKLVDNTLRDVVLGVKLVFAAPDGTPYDMGAPAAAWTSRPANSGRLVAALPGVVEYRGYADALLCWVESASVRDRLAALVESRPNGLSMIWNFAHGTPPNGSAAR